MTPFTWEALPQKVMFGVAAPAAVAEALEGLGARRALVLSTPPQADAAAELAATLGDRAAGTYTNATMHTPTDVTADAMRVVAELGADAVVSLGGGSTIGLGKAIALRTDLPQVVVPTTYAGSEATPIIGETEGGKKTTQRTLKVLPEVVVYDVSLTLTLPPSLSATSGMNAIAHAVEALYARDRNPLISLLAEEGIRALGSALPVIVANPRDEAARSDALYGAWACGTCLGSVGMALHHKIAHVLGGTFDLPHAETHTVLLPHTAAFNAPAAPEAMDAVARALGAADAAGGLFDLARRLGAPTTLRELGMPEDGIERAADLAVANPYWNPRPLERDALRDLIAAAFHGRPPLAAAA